MSDAAALLEKYEGRGVFIDTNLLVLLLVGMVNEDRISRFKRTRDFTRDDFRTLRNLVAWFGSPLVSTPHVLSQVSDLTDLAGDEGTAVRKLFREFSINLISETRDPASQLTQHRLFNRLGLADVSVAAVCERKVVVLTAHVQLQVALTALGLDAINFNHLRPVR